MVDTEIQAQRLSNKLGENLKNIRYDKQKSIHEVAKRLNMSMFHVHNIESGKYARLRIKVCVKLAECYEVELHDLFIDM